MTLFENRVVTDLMKSDEVIRVSPKAEIWSWTRTLTQGERHVKTKTKIGVMLLQAKKSQTLLTRRKV